MSLFLKSPVTLKARDADLRNPPLCEELRVRDILDSLAVTTSGAFVAVYELSGIHSHYHEDDTRNTTRQSLEAVLRALPERSLRMHVRFEIRQDAGNAIDRYIQSSRTENTTLQAVDKERQAQWQEKEAAGEFLDFRLHLMLHWDPLVHHVQAGQEWEQKVLRTWRLSAQQAIERARQEHETLVREFEPILAGSETTLRGTGMQFRRLNDEELFLLMQQSLNPVSVGILAYRRTNPPIQYESVRSRISNVSIEGAGEDYLKIGGLLYSF